jgi:DNA-binding transcriptional LysR family regulator
MELRHLRYFVAVAEELNFSLAAKKLHLSQPTLTRQVQDLEEEIGVTLLDRSRRRISLTRGGQVFLADSKRLLEMSRDNVKAVRALTTHPNAQLSIGYLVDIHNHFLPATLSAFRTAYPDVAVNLFDMSCAKQLDALRHGKLDMGFVGLKESLAGSDFQAEPFARYRMVLALRKSDSLAKRSKVELKKLESMFFVIFSESKCPGTREWLQTLCTSAAGFEPQILQEAPHITAMLNFVASGLGVALLPDRLTKFHAHDQVVFRETSPALEMAAYVAWRRDNDSKALHEFIHIVKQVALPTAA